MKHLPGPKRSNLWALFLTVCFGIWSTVATTIPYPDLKALVQGADHIFVGKVTKVYELPQDPQLRFRTVEIRFQVEVKHDQLLKTNDLKLPNQVILPFSNAIITSLEKKKYWEGKECICFLKGPEFQPYSTVRPFVGIEDLGKVKKLINGPATKGHR